MMDYFSAQVPSSMLPIFRCNHRYTSTPRGYPGVESLTRCGVWGNMGYDLGKTGVVGSGVGRKRKRGGSCGHYWHDEYVCEKYQR